MGLEDVYGKAWEIDGNLTWCHVKHVFFSGHLGTRLFGILKKHKWSLIIMILKKKHYLLEHHGIWKNIDNCQIIFFRCLSYLFLKIMADMFQKTKRVSFSILRPHCERWWWPERYGYCQIVTRLKSLKSPTCISSNVFLKMFYDVLWYCFYCLLLIIICVFDVSWCFMMFHDVSWCFTMFHDVSWCFMMFYDVLWCLFLIIPSNHRWLTDLGLILNSPLCAESSTSYKLGTPWLARFIGFHLCCIHKWGHVSENTQLNIELICILD